MHDNVVFGLAVDPGGDRIAVAAVNRVPVAPAASHTDGGSGLEQPPGRDVILIADGWDAAFASADGLITVGLGAGRELVGVRSPISARTNCPRGTGHSQVQLDG